MGSLDQVKFHPIRLKAYVFALIAAWSLTISASAILNIRQQREAVYEVARTQARTAYEQDGVYRRWNARHGGV